MATHKTKREEIEDEMVRVAKVLGGGWKWHQGVVPNIVLTLPEARALVEKIEILEDHKELDE